MGRHQIEPPTLAEVVSGMQENLAEAEAKLRAAEKLYDSLGPGDERLEKASCDRIRYRSDIRHWQTQITYWRRRAEREGPTTRLLPDGNTIRDRVPGEDDDV